MPSVPNPNPDADEEARRRFAERLEAYRKVAQHYRWPGVTLGPVDDFYDQTQDRKPGLKPQSGKRGLRFVEEMTIYDHDGTMLGYMTLSHSVVEPRWNTPAWLTPAYIHTTVTREDLMRLRRQS